MIPAEFIFAYYFVSAAVLIVGGGLMSLLTRRTGYLSRPTQRSLVFRRPVGPRLFLIIAGVWMISIPLLGAARKPGSELYFLIPATCIAGGFLILAATRRYELSLDVERRTYRFTYGPFFRLQMHSGSWQDFAGVFVRTGQTKGEDICAVGLDWRAEKHGYPYLGVFYNSAAAETFASQMAAEMDLPRVPAPDLEGLRSLFR